jgi:hypothetical protein
LCQLYDCLDKFEYKTKTSTNQYITNPGLWILGATTPNWIEIAMKQLGVGGGMTSRTIYVFSAKKGKHIPVTRMVPFDPVLRAKLITDLASIRQMAGRFKVTAEADAVYSEWYEGRYKETSISDARFASYWERLPSMVIKTSMIISASKRDDMVIDAPDIIHAVRMFEAIHPDMPQAFGALGYNKFGPQTEMVRALLRERKSITRSQILQTLRHNLSEWDYQMCRNSLLAERFCTRIFPQDTKDEVLVLIEQPGMAVESETNTNAQDE